jgi:hypothetical protein
MIGNFFGPNSQGVVMASGWVLARNQRDLMTAKLLFEKGYLSDVDRDALKQFK